MLNFDKIETQSHVKTLFNYCKKSGIFTLRKKPHPTYSKKIGDNIGFNHSGYLAFQYNKKVYLLHRLAFLYVNGKIPKMIDHKNQNRSDNTWDNIVESSYKENAKNQKSPKSTQTGVYGVSISKNGKFRSVIYVNNIRISLGTFSKKDDAIDARRHAEKIYGFSENHGKLPPQ